MRILIFSWRDISNPKAGGAELFTHEIAKRWVKAGHSVSLVSSRFTKAKEKETVDGVTIYRPSEFLYTPHDYFRYLYQTFRFYQNNLRGQADIVIDQIHGLPLFCKYYAREKVIAVSYEVAKKIWFYEFPFPYNLVGNLLEHLTLILYRRVPFITISGSTARDLKRACIKQVFTVPVGISFPPTKSLPQKTNFPLLVYLGRITKMKRIEELIKAFKFITDSFPKARLYIVGREDTGYSIGYAKNLKKLSQKLGLENKIKFLGFISQNEKIKLLKQAWVLASTSVREGWGIVVIEAAACGTPTVAYRVPGLVDSIRHQKTGLICTQNSPRELARNLAVLLSNQPLRERLSKNALAYSHRFNWNKTADKILASINKLKTGKHP